MTIGGGFGKTSFHPRAVAEEIVTLNAVHRISLAYSQAEDRLLLILRMMDRSEHRFWLTRRLIQLLWGPLVKKLESFPDVKKHLDAQVRQAVLSMRHRDVLEKSKISFSTLGEDMPKPAAAEIGRDGGPRDGGPRDSEPRDGEPRDGGPRDGGPKPGDTVSRARDEPSSPADGDTAALLAGGIPVVSGVSGRLLKGKVMQLVFRVSNDKTFLLNLNEKMLHVFCHLLVEMATKAEWNLDLGIEAEGGLAIEEGDRVTH